MNRNDFKRMANARLQDAKVLLDKRHYAGAYYLCGYAIECALKACIAKKTRRFEFPDRKMVNDSYTHDLEKLIIVAGLKQKLEQELAADATFSANWGVAIAWSEESRYQIFTRGQAVDLYDAVSDQQHGVLKWLSQHY